MIWLSHPTGNTFVRALLKKLSSEGDPFHFYTALGFSRSAPLGWLPAGLRGEFLRRQYDLDEARMSSRPLGDLGRLAASKLGMGWLARHESGPFCVDAVWRRHDAWVAGEMRPRQRPGVVYCYEDGALKTFERARDLGARRAYDLPIAHWAASRRLQEEERERLPGWRGTMPGVADSEAKLERKTRELELAEVVVVPSPFVMETLPAEAKASKQCVLAPFGSPPSPPGSCDPRPASRPMRVLFAGSMTQRKGLADLFAAMRLLKRRDVELVVMGTPVAPMDFYRSEFPDFTHEPTRPHAKVLELMLDCDLLALPSIVEGRALVQQEALACGLPLLVTPNAGGGDLVEEGSTGFLVPIRSPQILASKLDWLADRRDVLQEMRSHCVKKAAQYGWDDYATRVLGAALHPKPTHA